MTNVQKRLLCLTLSFLLILILVSCGKTSEDVDVSDDPAVEDSIPQPDRAQTTMETTVDSGGTEVNTNTTELDLTGAFALDTLLGVAEELTEVTAIHMGESTLHVSNLVKLQRAFPNARLSGSFLLFGDPVSFDAERLELPDMDPANTFQLIDACSLLPKLSSIEFIREDGTCAYTIEDISELDQLRTALPDVQLCVNFDLFGQTVSYQDTEIRYVDAVIGNEGLEQFYPVMPYLTSCEYLLLDECGIDYELLDDFRTAFPEVDIVWRIWLGPQYSVLTDVKKILASSDTEPRLEGDLPNALIYCRDLLYLDLGHNRITDISFVEHMPNLTVAILAINYWTDATPLASCTNLEYLEIFSTACKDLSPLSELENLRHLNVCNLRITDATPLYSLTNLERLWIGCTTSVPEEQLEELHKRLPNCEVNTTTVDPTSEGWRVHPRYELLREQMGYEDFDYQFWWRDEKFR